MLHLVQIIYILQENKLKEDNLDKKTLLPVQVTEEQKVKIKERAKQVGMTMSGFIRWMAIYADVKETNKEK